MRYREFAINEVSRGILFRTAGEKFFHTSDPKKFLDFEKINNFPENNKIQFDTVEQRDQALNQFMSANNVKEIYWFNKPTAGSLAFSIASFKNELGNTVYYGKYFSKNTGVQQWKNTDFNTLGYQLDTPSSKKGSFFKLKPADLIATNVEYNKPIDIINQINDEAIKNGLNMMPTQLPAFLLDAEKEPAVRDDLGEVIGPIAMWHGMDVGPQAEDARKFLLDNQQWKTCKIIFPQNKNEGLIDSILRPQKGVAIGISSKGGVGAKPSVKNLMAGINALRKNKSPGDKKLLEQYKNAVEMIETISKYSAEEGPITLGLQRNIIKTDTANALRSALTGKNISNNQRQLLMRLTQFKKTKAGIKSVLAYHALSGLARLVKDSLNNDKTINIQEAGLKLLNTSPLIQLYTNTKVVDDKITITGFRSVWPPQFTGVTTFDDRNYQTNRKPNGLMTFGMGKAQ